MTITQTHIHTVHRLYQSLAQFIEEYPTLDDTPRLARSSQIFDTLKVFLREFRGLQDAEKAGHSNYAKTLNEYAKDHDELLAIYQKAVMMHVDEPSGEYLTQLTRLQQHLAPFIQEAYRAVVAGIESNLDADQVDMLNKHMSTTAMEEARTA